MKHPADFLGSVLSVSLHHADVAGLLGDPATDHRAFDGYVPALSAARTGSWTPPPVHGRVLVAAAVRPGEK